MLAVRIFTSFDPIPRGEVGGQREVVEGLVRGEVEEGSDVGGRERGWKGRGWKGKG